MAHTVKHIHFLGICGTFMGSLAQLAKALGHKVTGSDRHVYPPMSTQLEKAGIDIYEGFGEQQFSERPDMVIIGNAMSRGNPAVEYVLNHQLPYTSGPQWLHDHVLQNKWVLAVAGTHGKTTTSSMLAWILEFAGMSPGYLIGGVPHNFSSSARLGESDFFVIEADEYDSAFFDKRSKFVHYLARTLILNNLEFDHADIFSDLAAIQTQFHHLVRTVPNNGLLIYPKEEKALEDVLDKGAWTPIEPLGQHWQIKSVERDKMLPFNKSSESPTKPSENPTKPSENPTQESLAIYFNGKQEGTITWSLQGKHNHQNALAAVVAARHVGVLPTVACEALSQFGGVKRRMELLSDRHGIKVYDDFAHHPTAIETTLAGLRQTVGSEKIIAIIEPRSNTMRMGYHAGKLAQSTTAADIALWYEPQDAQWSLADEIHGSPIPARLFHSLEALQSQLLQLAQESAHFVFMSNGSFGGLHHRFVETLNHHFTQQE